VNKVVAIMGLQYGSEAKGSIAGALARNWQPDTVATAWGPNAGHTVREGDFKFVSTMLATGALYPSVRTILIGPGSVVDFLKLAEEVERAGDRLRGKYLIIHPQAAYLKGTNQHDEKHLLRIGSTMKGTAAAVIDKMHRDERAVARGAPEHFTDPLLMVASKVGLHVSFSEKLYDTAIDESEKLAIEGAQGFSLGMHGQFYPYCTSREVSITQLLADTRMPMMGYKDRLAIIGVIRTYPIRVANRRGAEGQEYTSGGFYEDQHELDWRALGREPELTTVTKLPRRVFTFSHEQIYKAVRLIKPTALALTFCDYIEEAPSDALGPLHTGERVHRLIQAIRETSNRANHDVEVASVSYGPDMTDIYGVLTDDGKLDRSPFSLEKWGGEE